MCPQQGITRKVKICLRVRGPVLLVELGRHGFQTDGASLGGEHFLIRLEEGSARSKLIILENPVEPNIQLSD
jgi:hypothetical protein